jgi:hypothetical protein
VNDASDYARQVERYLCQKNGGHLVRVVGPAFELVRGWAETGVPLKIAFKGIDRCCERREQRGAGRRPLRIEFCEADVADAFDEWRRAVGVSVLTAGDDTPARKPALAAHIERAIARLANVRGVGAATTRLQASLEEIIRELETLAAGAHRARGEARAAIVARLGELDGRLMTAARAALDVEQAKTLRAEALQELAAFAERMPSEPRERATEAAFTRLVREAARLPTLTYE